MIYVIDTIDKDDLVASIQKRLDFDALATLL